MESHLFSANRTLKTDFKKLTDLIFFFFFDQLKYIYDCIGTLSHIVL